MARHSPASSGASAQLGKFPQAAESFEINFGVRLRTFAVIGRRQHRELFPQPELSQQVLDLRAQAAAGDGQRTIPGGVEHELRRAGNGGRPSWMTFS